MPLSEKARRDRQINENAVDWVLRMEGGPLTASERRDLDVWLQRNAAHIKAFNKAQRLFSDSGHALASDPDQAKRVIAGKGTGRSSRMLLPIILVIGGFYLADGPLWLRADYISDSREMPVLELADGSTVQLNSESALAENQKNASREVSLLKGEAYFEVARDPGRPFVVEAGDTRIEVLGTAFNVNLIGDLTEVTVTESKVRVLCPDMDDEFILEPGMRVVCGGGRTFSPIKTVSPELAAPWRTGRLVFDGQPLFRVIEEIFRHIPGDAYLFAGSKRSRRISGSFDLTDPEKALDSFAKVFGLEVVRAGGVLTIIY